MRGGSSAAAASSTSSIECSLLPFLTVRIRVSRDKGCDGALNGGTIDAAVARDVGEKGIDVREGVGRRHRGIFENK